MKGVSVIVCCFNSAARLRQTLKHLSLQKTDGIAWEVVLVDNASTDQSKEIALALWDEFGRSTVPLRIIDQPIQGLSKAREKGIDAALYDILIFCDDDNWLEDNYLRDAVSVMEGQSQVGALGGTGTAIADIPLPPWFEQYKGCYACYPQGQQDGELTDTYAFLYGAGLVVKREVFQRLSAKNFVPILPDRVGTALTSGGDTELSYAIRLVGYKLWFSKKLKFSHYLPTSRLTEEYLYRLISSMSYCSGLLIIYNYVLTGKKVNAMVWLKDATYQLFFFVRTSLEYVVRNDSLLSKKLDFAFSYNRMLSVFGQLGLYKSRFRQILQLKE